MTPPDASSRATEAEVPSPAPPHRVELPVNIHHWDSISFLHWPIAVHDLLPLVPDELTVLTHDGTAWVGLTPFFITVRPPGMGVPPGWAFPETNLRTYVRGPDGTQGLWFLRMEVTARWFVAALRSMGLPYVRQRMSVEATPDRLVYRSEPTGVSSDGGHDIVVRPGRPLDPAHGGAFERFLTAWWGAFHRRGTMLYTPVDHPPWQLREAVVETCDVAGMFRAAGLPEPTDEPVVHTSPGVTVKVGRPRRAR